VRRVLLVLVGVVVLAGVVVVASAALDEPSKSYRDAVVVDAPRGAIWALLTEFERYDEWNPYITSGTGAARPGGLTDLVFSTDEDNVREAAMLIVRPQRKLEWETRVIGPGILDREQIFRVLPRDDGRWDVVQEVRLEGVLAPFTDFDADRRGLVAMLEAISELAPRYQSSAP
jgi:hypothetical protein